MMYFGTPVWPIKWFEPYDEAIKKIHNIGFKGVELIAWDMNVLDYYYTPKNIKKIKRLLADSDLKLTNFNCSVRKICSLNEEDRQRSKDGFEKAIETAAQLGAEMITTVSPFPFSMIDSYKRIIDLPLVQEWRIDHDLNYDFQENYIRFASDMKDLCQHASKHGLKLLIEPHPYRWINSASSMLRLIDHVNEDNLGFNLDPSHLFASGEIPQRTIYELRGRVWHTHFSDNDTLTNVHWRPGKGKVDWYAVMKALKDVGFDGEISFELEDVPGAATPEKESTDEMTNELKLSIKFITEICNELKIDID